MSHVMIDTIHLDAGNIPEGTPYVAGYVTGSPSIQWTSADWERFAGSLRKVRINQSATPELVKADYDVIDCELGVSKDCVSRSVTAAMARQKAGKDTTIYVDLDLSDDLTSALKKAGAEPDSVHLWLADYNLSHAEAESKLGTRIGEYTVKAVQWASPSSNPSTLVPGSSLTLKAANVDLSVVRDGWLMPSNKTTALTMTFTSHDDGKTWTLKKS